MGSRRDVLLLAGLLLGLAVLALVVRPYAARSSPDDPRATTFRYGPDGAAALYHLMGELDLPARRLLRPWAGDSGAGVLVVLAPGERATPHDVQALLGWIEAGGTLIYAPGQADGLRSALGLFTIRLRPDTLAPLQAVRWKGATAFAATHALSAGIDSVPGFRAGFAQRSTPLRQDSAHVLLRTREDIVTAMLFRRGAGTIVAFSDAAALSNAMLREGGAALLFTRAAADALGDGGELRFDEFHHGFREAGTVRTVLRFLTGTGPGRALLQAVVAVLALLLLAGARFGAPLDPVQTRRRSPLEHVQALASGYERADARRSARRLLLSGLERRLGRRVLGAHGTMPAAALDASPAGRRLKEEWERGEAGDLTALAAAIDDFVGEVRRWK